MSTEKFTVSMFNISTATLDVKRQDPGGKQKRFSSKEEALNFAEQNANYYYKIIVKDSNSQTIRKYLKGKPV